MCRGYGTVQRDILDQLGRRHYGALSLEHLAGDGSIESYRRAVNGLVRDRVVSKLSSHKPGGRWVYVLRGREMRYKPVDPEGGGAPRSLLTGDKNWDYAMHAPTTRQRETHMAGNPEAKVKITAIDNPQRA